MSVQPRVLRFTVPMVAALVAVTCVLAAAFATGASAGVPTNDAVFTLTYGTDIEQTFTSVARAADGSVFAAGNRQSTRGDTDFILVKIRPDGSVAWHREYDTPAHWSEVPRTVSVSAAGVVALAGDTWKGPGEERGLVVAWSTQGKLLWARQIKAPVAGYAQVAGAVTDRDGRVFVAGRAWNGVTAADLQVTAYAMSGVRLWQRLVDGGAKAFDGARAVTLDKGGDLYVGANLSRATTGSAAAILKYTPGGRRLWLRTYDDGTTREHVLNDIAVRGSVVGVCGFVIESGTNDPKALVARYDTSGRRRWAYVVGDPWRDTEYSSIAIDGYSHLVVGGYQDFGAGWNADALVSRFEPTGGHSLWDWSIAGPGEAWDVAADVAVTSEGDIYAAGPVGNADGTRDAFVVHLRPVLATDWMTRYTVAGDEEGFSALVLDAKGVTAAGWADDKALLRRFTLEVAP